MKKMTIILLAVALMLSMVACSSKSKVDTKPEAFKDLSTDQVEKLEDDLDAFNSGNIADITALVFPDATDTTTEADTQNGIIADLFANAEVDVIAVENDTITYTVTSPDLSNFFIEKYEELQLLSTSEELRQMLLEYAKTAPRKEYTVLLPCSGADTTLEIDYTSAEFINAMTGGLLDAYSALYDQYLTEEDQ